MGHWATEKDRKNADRVNNAGKGGHYRPVDKAKYESNHVKIFGPSKMDLDRITSSSLLMADVISTLGIAKTLRNSEERHRIPVLQQMKYEIDMMLQGCQCREWMKEGVLKGPVIDDRDLGPLQTRIMEMLSEGSK